MMFKNSIKLLCANFDKVWKLLVYHIICIAISVGLLAVFNNQYIDFATIAFNQTDLGNVFQTGTLYGTSFSNALTSVVDFIVVFFKEMFNASVFQGVYFCIVVFFIFPLFLNVGKYVTCEMMYGYMSSCQKQSFTGTFLKTLKSSLSYAVVKVIYSIPFNALIAFSMWGLTRVNNKVFDYVMPFAFVIIPALLMAFKELLNGGWAPAKVVYAQNPFSAFTIGTQAVFRRGERVFSTAFIIYLLAIVLSMILGLYSIIIILPVVFPLIHIFEMVMFFSSQGMRFYVDNDTILSPKKLEEKDGIEKAKYLL